MHLTVVLPTYNEAANLKLMIGALFALDLPLDVLIVDDNSPDGTGVIADELAKTYPDRVRVHHRPGRQGLAMAYLDGFARALERDPDLVLQMDCDFSHQPADIPRLLAAMTADVDLMLGSRFMPGGSVDPGWSAYRKLLSGFANRIYVPSLLGLPLRDATGGFRLWRAAALRAVADPQRIRCNGYAFQVEMAYVAWKMGYAIREEPIFFPDRARGQSKMSAAIQFEAAWQVLAMRRRHRRLRPTGSPTPGTPGAQRHG